MLSTITSVDVLCTMNITLLRLFLVILFANKIIQVVNTVHWDEPIRLQDFSTNQIQGLRSRSQRF